MRPACNRCISYPYWQTTYANVVLPPPYLPGPQAPLWQPITQEFQPTDFSASLAAAHSHAPSMSPRCACGAVRVAAGGGACRSTNTA